MGDLAIRTANREDIPQLLNLMYQYIVDFYKRPKPTEESLKGLIQYLLDNPASGIQFVAEQDGKLLGFATLYFSFSTLQVKRMAILNDLFVIPEARGQKLGEKLFQTCLSYIREHDFAYMTWETAKDNLVAQSLYNKMGGQWSEWLVYEIS
ncbi:GNAT family N-acetyltransferase [Parageobacillus thermoglucosidasius]|uniref:GCN5-related N-acetyltransferase n=1 Tax=Geobacillus sp. (strain Y4.1MC1) TaxID=581103 RepID=A0A7U4DL44_GEOS0|nr:GNAT family N-acetyltransferase [Parageobacillus thermoglucosidasius]AEH47935.1 GCN5-related N-acetyltransferase [Parageobacillus thermoglucosidasius C56-YS93]